MQNIHKSILKITGKNFGTCGNNLFLTRPSSRYFGTTKSTNRQKEKSVYADSWDESNSDNNLHSRSNQKSKINEEQEYSDNKNHQFHQPDLEREGIEKIDDNVEPETPKFERHPSSYANSENRLGMDESFSGYWSGEHKFKIPKVQTPVAVKIPEYKSPEPQSQDKRSQ